MQYGVITVTGSGIHFILFFRFSIRNFSKKFKFFWVKNKKNNEKKGEKNKKKNRNKNPKKNTDEKNVRKVR